jgi:adenylate cyclase
MAIDWAAEGLLDGLEGRAREERVGLLDTLIAEGVPLEEVKRSNRDGEILFLLAGRAIDLEFKWTWEEVVEQCGLDEQGTPRPVPGERSFTDSDVGLLKATAKFLDAGMPEDEVVAIGRLLGRGFEQAAEAMRGSAMAMILEPGMDERELALRYARVAGMLTPMVEPMLGHMLRLQLGKLVHTELISAEERATGRLPGARPVAFAFADLVGFTKLGEEVPPDELGAVADRLEHLVLDVVEPPVRFVKTIGDAAMLAAPEPAQVLDVVLDLVDAAEAEGADFPQLRVGVASGPALARAGDYFGRPVNLASRLTGIARPGSILATAEVQGSAPDAYRWSKAGIRPIKGIPEPVALWRARRLADDGDDD